MSKIKILYVEDEPYLGKIVKESLESRNFEVNMVADGGVAVPAFEQYRPDVCVLDVMLPHKDGFTIGQEIRALNAHVPILYLTAKNQMEDLAKGFAAGGNDYIKKPFSVEELIIRINNLLKLMHSGSHQQSISTSGQLGQYVFDAKRYELQLGDSSRKLSHREAQLLQILSEKRNQSVERKDILLKVWGDDSFFNSRNLDVYIKKLRDYLKEDEEVNIITLKGIGYRFVVP